MKNHFTIRSINTWSGHFAFKAVKHATTTIHPSPFVFVSLILVYLEVGRPTGVLKHRQAGLSMPWGPFLFLSNRYW
jgi:hypothetical protein